MEKTKLMLEYEKQTGLLALCSEYDEWTEKEYWFTTTKYSEWLEARLAESQTKATAYDRLVSKTIISDAELDAPLAQRILREMCEKAEAYDRISTWHDDLPKNDGRYICAIGNGGYPVICAKRFENGRWLLGEREKIKWAYLPDGWEVIN